MKLDVKLDHFYQSVIDDATAQSDAILKDYQDSLDKIYNDQKKDLLRKAKVSLQVESDYLIRQKNKALSSEAVSIRRKISEKDTELKDKLFVDVEKRLIDYMKTKEYEELLVKQINHAVTFAHGEHMTIYINASDEAKKEQLEQTTNVSLTISATDFLGGTRAVIHEKHILIDNSFTTKLAEEKDIFTF